MNCQTRSMVSAYAKRNDVLKLMGFESYGDYLKSHLWHSIRANVLRLNPKCVACEKPSTEVHHGSYGYPTMSGSESQHLYSICRDHHQFIEFELNGEKRSPKLATRRLRDLIAGTHGHSSARAEKKTKIVPTCGKARKKREKRALVAGQTGKRAKSCGPEEQRRRNLHLWSHGVARTPPGTIGNA